MSDKTIHSKLEKLDGYLISINRNIDTEAYELEVGFRKDWVYKSTSKINCDVIVETENGSRVNISGKDDDVVIDDLIRYVIKVIDKNQDITNLQMKFKEEMEKRKEEFANILLECEKSFDDFDNDETDDEESDDEETEDEEEKL